MADIIINILIALATVLAAPLERYLTPLALKAINEAIPAKRRHKIIMVLAVKYIFFALMVLVVYSVLADGKLFVLFMCMMFLLGSYFITRDHFYYMFHRMGMQAEKEDLLNEKQLWLRQLATCDRNDEQRHKMIFDKIEAIDKKLTEL